MAECYHIKQTGGKKKKGEKNTHILYVDSAVPVVALTG